MDFLEPMLEYLSFNRKIYFFMIINLCSYSCHLMFSFSSFLFFFLSFFFCLSILLPSCCSFLCPFFPLVIYNVRIPFLVFFVSWIPSAFFHLGIPQYFWFTKSTLSCFDFSSLVLWWVFKKYLLSSRTLEKEGM